MSDLYDQDWQAIHTPMWAKLDEFRPETLRVFLFLLRNVERKNHIRLRPIDVAEGLKISRSAANRNIGRLVDEGILVPRADYGWRLHPSYGFKGNPAGVVTRTRNGGLAFIDHPNG